MHAEADSYENTDWQQTLALYNVLDRFADDPMVAVNRAVAVSQVHGPAAGLALLDSAASDPGSATTIEYTPSAPTSCRPPANSPGPPRNIEMRPHAH